MSEEQQPVPAPKREDTRTYNEKQADIQLTRWSQKQRAKAESKAKFMKALQDYKDRKKNKDQDLPIQGDIVEQESNQTEDGITTIPTTEKAGSLLSEFLPGQQPTDNQDNSTFPESEIAE